MSVTFGLFTQVSGSGPLGPLVVFWTHCIAWTQKFSVLICNFGTTNIKHFTVSNYDKSEQNKLNVITKPTFFWSVCISNTGVIKFFSQLLVQDKWPVKIHLS